MITRLEATRYRCFERLGVDLGDFRVLVGANGSGKTTLLDIPVLLAELLAAPNIGDAFLLERSMGRPPRASSFQELLFCGSCAVDTSFSFAVEARLPEHIQKAAVDALLSGRKATKAAEQLRTDPTLWPSYVRYELGLDVFNQRELQVKSEYLFTFPESGAPDRGTAGLHGEMPGKSTWRFMLRREYGARRAYGGEVEYTKETAVSASARGATARTRVESTLLALPRFAFESSSEYPVARWFLDLLKTGAVFLDPDWNTMRLASPPGQPAGLIPSGRNLPWLALALKQLDAPSRDDPAYRSPRYTDWVAHVQTALSQVEDIDVREREADHHAYFVVRYRGGYEVPSMGLSEGTLRILTLTLLPYLSTLPSLLCVEEPENGIHPRAIEAVLQSLSSLYDSQVWVSSHSPVVLAHVDLDQVLCARLGSETGEVGVEIIPGREHPRLAQWRSTLDLGSLFAAGVLG